MKAFQDAAVARYESTWLADRVHEVGAVPASPPTPYGVVSVTSGAGTHYRVGAHGGSTSRRAVVQCVGKTAGEVAFAVEKAEAAYLGHRLAVAGHACTPMRSEVSSPVIRDPDGGALLTCTLTFTFSSTPA